jgi:hypothetical protein
MAATPGIAGEGSEISGSGVLGFVRFEFGLGFGLGSVHFHSAFFFELEIASSGWFTTLHLNI